MAIPPVSRPAAPLPSLQLTSEQVGPRVAPDPVDNEFHQAMVDSRQGPVQGETSTFGPRPGSNPPVYTSFTKTGADQAEVTMGQEHAQPGQLQQLQEVSHYNIGRQDMSPTLAASTLGRPDMPANQPPSLQPPQTLGAQTLGAGPAGTGPAGTGKRPAPPLERPAGEVQQPRLSAAPAEAGPSGARPGQAAAPHGPPAAPGAPGPSGPGANVAQAPGGRAASRPITDDERRTIFRLNDTPHPDGRRRTHQEIANDQGVGRQRDIVSRVLRGPRPGPAAAAPEGQAARRWVTDAGRQMAFAPRRPLTDTDRREIYRLRNTPAPPGNHRRTHEEIARETRRGQATIQKVLREPRPDTPPPAAEAAPEGWAQAQAQAQPGQAQPGLPRGQAPLITDDERRTIHDLARNPAPDGHFRTFGEIADGAGTGGGPAVVRTVLQEPRPRTPPPAAGGTEQG